MKKDDKRIIPTKNYVKALLLLIFVVLVVLYAREIYILNQEGKYTQSILSRAVGEINYDEIDTVLVESANDYYLYISYVNNNDVDTFEKKLDSIIADYELGHKFYYLNVTERIDDQNLLKDLNKKFQLNNEIKDLPAILYFEDGVYQGIISGDNVVFNFNNVKAFVHKYENKE